MISSMFETKFETSKYATNVAKHSAPESAPKRPLIGVEEESTGTESRSRTKTFGTGFTKEENQDRRE